MKRTSDGRVILDLTKAADKRQYKADTETMRQRQGNTCCLRQWAPMCRGWLKPEEATFDHEHGRGMNGGKRDDRIVLPNGDLQNGAAHLACNTWKGSRYIPYNDALNRGRKLLSA